MNPQKTCTHISEKAAVQSFVIADSASARTAV